MDGQMDAEAFEEMLQRACRRVLRDVKKFRTPCTAPRNFSIKLSHDQGLDVILCRDDEEEFPLSQLLPSGTRFKKSKTFQYDMTERVVELRTQDRDLKYFLPVTLHEIGHANEPVVFGIRRHYDHNLAKTKNFVRGISELINSPKQLTNLSEVFSEDEQAIYERTCAEHRYEALSERNAWMYSFNQLKSLHRQGYDAYADLDKRKLIRLARLSLRSHELDQFAMRSDIEWPDIDLEPYCINRPLFTPAI